MPKKQRATKPGCVGCRLLQERDQRIRQLEAQNEELRQALARVQEQLEQLQREAHRQAAPFRRSAQERKPLKRRPGRKPGHPPSYRQPPPVIDEAVEVPLPCCPQCHGPLQRVRPVTQIIEDIPPVQVRRLQLTTYRGHCPRCGLVCSTHPEQVSTATGAAGTHLGRNALALAADLRTHFGLPMGKVCGILREHFGLRLTPGGLSQALARIAAKLQVPFIQLCQALRQSPAVHADETGWWLGGQSAWLWVFTNSGGTRFVVDNRSQEVVRRVLGDDYAGVLVSDCLASYDPHPGRKSKCCAHHLKAISEALEQAPGSAFLREMRGFFRAAMMLHRLREQIAAGHYEQAVAHLQQRLDELLAAPRGDPAEQRIRNRLLKHRPHLLTFLLVAGVAPTNNLAERQLRPAVIVRKLSCGNKTDRGKLTFEVLASLAATCAQQGRSFVELVANGLPLDRSPPPLLQPQRA